MKNFRNYFIRYIAKYFSDYGDKSGISMSGFFLQVVTVILTLCFQAIFVYLLEDDWGYSFQAILIFWIISVPLGAIILSPFVRYLKNNPRRFIKGALTMFIPYFIFWLIAVLLLTKDWRNYEK